MKGSSRVDRPVTRRHGPQRMRHPHKHRQSRRAGRHFAECRQRRPSAAMRSFASRGPHVPAWYSGIGSEDAAQYSMIGSTMRQDRPTLLVPAERLLNHQPGEPARRGLIQPGSAQMHGNRPEQSWRRGQVVHAVAVRAVTLVQLREEPLQRYVRRRIVITAGQVAGTGDQLVHSGTGRCMACRHRARNSSSVIAVRATPIRATSGASAPSAPRRRSLRAVRSPEAPKITSAQGGVRPGTAAGAGNAASAVVETANFRHLPSMARARVFPSTPSFPAARVRDEHRTAAGAPRRPGGSCPRAAVRAAPGNPPGTTPGRAAPAHCPGSPLGGVAELLDLVGEHPPARRELVPQPEGPDRGIPLDHRRPVLVPVRERGVAAEHDEPAARPQRAEGAQRQRAAERVEHDVHAFAAGQLAHPSQEVLVPVFDRDRSEPLDRGEVARRARPVQAKPGRRAELERRDAHPAGRAVHEHRLAGLHRRGAMQCLVGGHVREQQADDLRRVEVLGHLDHVRRRHADALRVAPHTVSAPIRSPSRSLVEPGPSSSTTPTSS